MVRFSQKEFPLKDITERIISCAIEVHSTLGPGLLESVYEEALGYEFQLRRIPYERQKEIVIFDNFSVFSVVSFDNTLSQKRSCL